ncbi:hypothetical protein T06_1664 [Trichinella sp. T6]|nr:hypothetical protein T06_1664 [Trichinella sp. T6]
MVKKFKMIDEKMVRTNKAAFELAGCGAAEFESHSAMPTSCLLESSYKRVRDMSQRLGCPEKRPNQRLTLDATGEINSRQPVEKLWRNRIDQSPSPLRTPPFVETQKASNNEASKPMPSKLNERTHKLSKLA